MAYTPSTTTKSPKNKYHLLTILAVLAAVWAIGLFFYTTRDAVYAEMTGLKLIPAPERFTELYFNNYLSLPKSTVAGNPVTFSFTIHNLEGVTTDYLYTVYYESPSGGRTPIQSGIAALADGESRPITVTYTFLNSNLPGVVVVELPRLNQNIDFLLAGNTK